MTQPYFIKDIVLFKIQYVMTQNIATRDLVLWWSTAIPIDKEAFYLQRMGTLRSNFATS